MDEYEDLGMYMIKINSPPGPKIKSHYDLNEFGGGSISVYKVLEGTTPSDNSSVRHIKYVGGFVLKSEHNKTLGEFIQEVRDGLSKIVSSGK